MFIEYHFDLFYLYAKLFDTSYKKMLHRIFPLQGSNSNIIKAFPIGFSYKLYI